MGSSYLVLDTVTHPWLDNDMPATTTHYVAKATETEAAMSATITVDLSKTIGQESAIHANGGPLFLIRVTCPARELSPTKAGVAQSIPGFGRVVCSGPVKGYEVLYTLDSVVG